VNIRHLEEDDYQPIIAVIDDWWGGRHIASLLPRIFFVHFRETSFAIAESRTIIGFLAGFVSQTYPQQAYIQFVGIHPDHRRRGLGRWLLTSAIWNRGIWTAPSPTRGGCCRYLLSAMDPTIRLDVLRDCSPTWVYYRSLCHFPGEQGIHRLSRAYGLRDRRRYGGMPGRAVRDQLRTERRTPSAVCAKSFLDLLRSRRSQFRNSEDDLN